ncbi:hypothetical protein BDC45DRAFT_564594 [Circinella umbellata]|nr:hypothetical protein BDC45DRAFT_564594 [Circinella umbellata]
MFNLRDSLEEARKGRQATDPPNKARTLFQAYKFYFLGSNSETITLEQIVRSAGGQMRVIPGLLILGLKEQLWALLTTNQTEPYCYIDSNDGMEFESTAIGYRNNEMIVNFNGMKEAEIERMIEAEGLSIPKAAAQCGIPRSIAYELINEFNSIDGAVPTWK